MRTGSPRRFRAMLLSLGALLVVGGGVVAIPGVAQAAGGCFDEGCNNKYYNSGGASCTDHRRKSNVVYGNGAYSTTDWSLEIRYSSACGAAFAYLHNFTENFDAEDCGIQFQRSSDSGATWTIVAYAWESVETPTYNFAYTRMVGDAGSRERVRARVVCFLAGDSNAYYWATET